MGELSYSERADQIAANASTGSPTWLCQAIRHLGGSAEDEIAALKAEVERLRGRVAELEAWVDDNYQGLRYGAWGEAEALLAKGDEG